jgi:hypothetical protein
MAKHISEKCEQTIAVPKSFSHIVSLIEGVFSEHPIEVNHLKKSFRSKKSSTGQEVFAIEGFYLPTGFVKLTIRIAKILPPGQIPAIPFWQHLSALDRFEILPLISNTDDSKEFWITYTIEPDQLGYLQQPVLQNTLEEITKLANFFKESVLAIQTPEISKMVDLYDKINYQFVKPFPKTDFILPAFLKIVDSIYPSLVSGNPVIIKHQSPLVLEYVACALATIAWKGGHHFGLLKHLLPYGQALNSIDKVTGIPVIPLNFLLKDETGFNFSHCYSALYQLGRSTLFFSTETENSYPELLNVYSIKSNVPIKDILFNCIFQLSNDLSIQRIEQLSEEANEIIQPFYTENENEITNYIPSFCRLLLHLNQTAPSQLKNKLTANLFHHFE